MGATLASTVAITSARLLHKVVVAMVVAVDVAFALRGSVAIAHTGTPVSFHTARMAKPQRAETAAAKVTDSTARSHAALALHFNVVSATEGTRAASAIATGPVPVPTGAVEEEAEAAAHAGPALRFNAENVTVGMGAAFHIPKGLNQPPVPTGEAVAAVDHEVCAFRGSVANVIMGTAVSFRTRMPVRTVAVLKIKTPSREKLIIRPDTN